MAIVSRGLSLERSMLLSNRPCGRGSAPSLPGMKIDPQRGFRRRRLQCRAVAGMDWTAAIHGIVLGVGIGLPCTVMDCGDAIYRSGRVDPLEITAGGVALGVLIVSYLWATPGVAPGFWDMFILAPLEKRLRPSYNKDDLHLERKMGEGAFGVVYKASFVDPKKESVPLVVKKASEYGEVEAWMNRRVRRACPGKCADYIDGFKTRTKNRKEYWLVWRYEGDTTLAGFMSSKEFPYNVERALELKTTQLPRGSERESEIIRTLMQQLLRCLASLHSIGIVHRDIKPQNIIFSEDSKCFKIIDLGAATDLRVGINYIPQEFLLDPRYAAPEQYIMSTSTPSAPHPVMATALSPVLWKLNSPDRFDVYSLGLMFLQMAFANLRSDSALIQFNRQLKRLDNDIVAWREFVENRGNPDVVRGFEILDMDGGVGWELLKAMVQFKGGQRISAPSALGHPYFVKLKLLKTSVIQNLWLGFINFTRQDRSKEFAWVIDLMVSGPFTEVELERILEQDNPKKQKKKTAQLNPAAVLFGVGRKVADNVTESVEEMKKRPKKQRPWWMDTTDDTLEGIQN